MNSWRFGPNSILPAQFYLTRMAQLHGGRVAPRQYHWPACPTPQSHVPALSYLAIGRMARRFEGPACQPFSPPCCMLVPLQSGPTCHIYPLLTPFLPNWTPKLPGGFSGTRNQYHGLRLCPPPSWPYHGYIYGTLVPSGVLTALWSRLERDFDTARLRCRRRSAAAFFAWPAPRPRYKLAMAQPIGIPGASRRGQE
jgi:hypothetical protein